MTDTVRVGNIEIAAVLDMVPPPRDPTVFIKDQPRSAWAPYEEEVLEDGMQPEVLPTAPHVSQSVIPLDDLGLVEFIDDGHSVTDEITTWRRGGRRRATRRATR